MPATRWRCTDCDTWNAPTDRKCHCCGTRPKTSGLTTRRSNAMSLTYTQADANVRETAHRFANTHLPQEKRWELAREHEANLAAREAALAAIPYPDETEAAWAEHAERERILSAYRGAATRIDATAARWEAYEYDLANPGASPLVDQLDEPAELAAA